MNQTQKSYDSVAADYVEHFRDEMRKKPFDRKMLEWLVEKVEQELEFTKAYLDIEKIRFQERLVVEMSVMPDALDAHVPNLIFQPLIENAVRHGVARQTAIGILRIQARREAERLLVKIEDNGPGLKGNGKRKTENGDGGVGLANTRARLEQFYGNDFRFEIERNSDSTGTTVNLNLPFID